MTIFIPFPAVWSWHKFFTFCSLIKPGENSFTDTIGSFLIQNFLYHALQQQLCQFVTTVQKGPIGRLEFLSKHAMNVLYNSGWFLAVIHNMSISVAILATNSFCPNELFVSKLESFGLIMSIFCIHKLHEALFSRQYIAYRFRSILNWCSTHYQTRGSFLIKASRINSHILFY